VNRLVFGYSIVTTVIIGMLVLERFNLKPVIETEIIEVYSSRELDSLKTKYSDLFNDYNELLTSASFSPVIPLEISQSDTQIRQTITDSINVFISTHKTAIGIYTVVDTLFSFAKTKSYIELKTTLLSPEIKPSIEFVLLSDTLLTDSKKLTVSGYMTIKIGDYSFNETKALKVSPYYETILESKYTDNNEFNILDYLYCGGGIYFDDKLDYGISVGIGIPFSKIERLFR